MSQTMLSDEARAFVVRSIESYEQLEVLTMLARAPARDWSAEEVAAELRTSRMSASQSLAHLSRQGVISAQPDTPHRFRYGPSTVSLERAVDELARSHRDLRVSIIDLIFAKPPGDDRER